MTTGPALYQPSEWGTRFHSLVVDEALGAGSAGPGKSLVLLHDADEQIAMEHKRAKDKKHPFHHGMGMSTGWALHLRRTSPMLMLSIQRAHRIFPIMDPGAKWNADSKSWRFSSGYQYQFGHCDELNDWDRYLSFEYTWIGFDELVQFTETQYDQIITRLRSSDPVLSKMLKVRSMSNPVMRREVGENFTVHDPFWVRRRFVDPAPEGNVILKRKLQMDDGSIEWNRWIYLPAKLTDNPDPAFARSYEKRLQNAPQHMRQALLRGDWYVTEGSFFGAVWNPQLHVCEPFRIPSDWPAFRTMDWGFKQPGCVHWWALDQEGTVYCFKEYNFNGHKNNAKNKTADKVADDVVAIEKELGLWGKNGRSKITGPADTQLWEERGQHAKTMAQVFLEKGVPWTKADKKSRKDNAQRLYRLLDSHENGTQQPGLVIFKHCINLMRTIPAIQTDSKQPDMPADGGEDHWVDSAFYASAHVSRGKSYVGARHDDDDDYDEEEKARGSRGSYGYGSAVC